MFYIFCKCMTRNGEYRVFFPCQKLFLVTMTNLQSEDELLGTSTITTTSCKQTFQSRCLSRIQTAAFLGYRNINFGDGMRHYICRRKQLEEEATREN